MKKVIDIKFKERQNKIDNFISSFDSEGTQFGKAARNSIRLFEFDELTLNIKSFKTPNLINQIVYNFFRKSKAQRSFEYANKLKELDIGTPQPIAYYEFPTTFLFKKSFYVSEHLDCDLTFRELTTNFNYPEHEKILRAFTRFTFELHEKGVNFLDHSPGNTLIKKGNNNYSFYLVDLNRMEFGKLDFEQRLRNFERLTEHKQLVEIMGDEYSKCINADYNKVFERMWFHVQKFQRKYSRRQELKRKFKS